MKLVKPWRIKNIQESVQEKGKNNFFRHNSKYSKDEIFFCKSCIPKFKVIASSHAGIQTDK